MEYKGHTHVKFCRTRLTDLPYRFRVEAYLTSQEFNDLTDDAKLQCNEIRGVDFAIIDRLIADLPMSKQKDFQPNHSR